MSRDAVVQSLLFALAVLCIGNLNGIAYMMLGISQLFSPAILVCALLLVALNYRFTPVFAAMFAAGLILNLLLAVLFGALFGAPIDLLYVSGPVGFTLIVLAVSSSINSLSDHRISALMRALAWLTAAISFLTLLSPYLVAVTYVSRP